MKLKSNVILICIVAIVLFNSCSDDEKIFSPKPRGYFRIDLPEKKYLTTTSECPFQFEIPEYAYLIKDQNKNAEPCWFNLEFKRFKATLHLSYKELKNDIEKHLENSHYFANKHQVKATGLDEIPIIRIKEKVYGLL